MARGVHGRQGPPPDPNALRRDRDDVAWLLLPPEGRKGRAPAWPLSKASTRERAVWRQEWKRPQAIAWERNRQQLEVALYVRCLIAAEQPDASAAARGLVLRQQEALGISLPGLARNRWRIASARPAAAPTPRARTVAKARFHVVQGGNTTRR